MLQDETLEVLVGAMACFSWFVLGIKVFTLCLSGLGRRHTLSSGSLGTRTCAPVQNL